MSDFTLDLSLQVGKYDIQKLLGKGATGTVYLAKRPRSPARKWR